ncbi:MAG: hypothetical protein HW406_2708, partial [Candidatus Brocadiaceae bacterium]|nr:hypothetical protein [Candidatus Brocadiaceae bacterium]
MKRKFHVRFLEEGEGAISPSYSANTRNSITSQDEKLVNMQMSIGYKSGLQKQLKMVFMTITNNCCPIQRVIRGLSRMKGNFHVRFLEEGEGAISPSYSAIFTFPCTSASS